MAESMASPASASPANRDPKGAFEARRRRILARGNERLKFITGDVAALSPAPADADLASVHPIADSRASGAGPTSACAIPSAEVQELAPAPPASAARTGQGARTDGAVPANLNALFEGLTLQEGLPGHAAREPLAAAPLASLSSKLPHPRHSQRPRRAMASMERIHSAAESTSLVRWLAALLYGLVYTANFIISSPSTCSPIPDRWAPIASQLQERLLAVPTPPTPPLVSLFVADLLLIIAVYLLTSPWAQKEPLGASKPSALGGTSAEQLPEVAQSILPQGLDLEDILEAMQRAGYSVSRAKMAWGTLRSLIIDACTFIVVVGCILALWCPLAAS